LTAGWVFRQIARLHHFSPFSMPSLVAHMDFQAMRSGWMMCSVGAFPALLMDQVKIAQGRLLVRQPLEQNTFGNDLTD
jgi:hypothetical protein